MKVKQKDWTIEEGGWRRRISVSRRLGDCRRARRAPRGRLPAVSLLTDLDAFFTDHHHCGDLDAGVDWPIVWIACPCGASMARRAESAMHLPPTIDPPYRSRMDRRRFLLTSLVGAFAAPPAARAQQTTTLARVGFLSLHITAAHPSPLRDAFLSGLRDAGWIAGRNIMIEYRHAASDPAGWQGRHANWWSSR